MTVTVSLMLMAAVALTAAVVGPRVLTGASWPEREPVLALWVWQCLVATVLLCCLSSLVLSASAVFHTVRAHVFAPAPPSVTAAYDLAAAPPWTTALTLLLAGGAAWTTAMLAREVTEARRRSRLRREHLRERAPERKPGCRPPAARSSYWRTSTRTPGGCRATRPSSSSPRAPCTASPTTSWTPSRPTNSVTPAPATTGSCISPRRWPHGFPGIPVFRDFRDQTHRLVELSADDTASRRCGHLTTALALIELNQHRGVLSCATPRPLLHQRVERLLDPPPRLTRSHRRGTTTAAALAPLIPLLIAFAPALTTLAS